MLATQALAADAAPIMDQLSLLNLNHHHIVDPDSVDLASLKKKVRHIKSKKKHNKKKNKKHGKKHHKKNKKLHKAKIGGGRKHNKKVKQDVVIQRPLWEDFFGGRSHHGHFGMPFQHDPVSHGFYGQEAASFPSAAWGHAAPAYGQLVAEPFYGHNGGFGNHFGAVYGNAHDFAPRGHFGAPAMPMHQDVWGAPAYAHHHAAPPMWGLEDLYSVPQAPVAAPHPAAPHHPHNAYPFSHYAAAPMYGGYGSASPHGFHDMDTFGDYMEDIHDDYEDEDDFDDDEDDFEDDDYYGYGGYADYGYPSFW